MHAGPVVALVRVPESIPRIKKNITRICHVLPGKNHLNATAFLQVYSHPREYRKIPLAELFM